eukprot:499469-Rhodomonas_salina.2
MYKRAEAPEVSPVPLVITKATCRHTFAVVYLREGRGTGRGTEEGGRKREKGPSTLVSQHPETMKTQTQGNSKQAGRG